jgi:acyl-CoA synthetase (AMP-forming)/AMP-acid ligase II
VLDDERISHERHLQLVERFAASVVELGVRKGDRVAIAMRNLPEWSIAFFGAAMAGAIAVPINAFGTGEELAIAIADADAKVVVADRERLERLATVSSALAGRVVIGTRLDDSPADVIILGELLENDREVARVDIEPDDFATIFYTSGTTTRPKGVSGPIGTSVEPRQHDGVRTMLTTRRARTPPAGALWRCRLPCHGVPLDAGRPGVLRRDLHFHVALGRGSRAGFIERERDLFSGVPTMLGRVNSPTLERPAGMAGGGGAASPPELVRRIHERFPASGSATGYGLTETSSITASIGGKDYLDRPASVGIPVPICEVRIVAENGTDATRGDPGEIWIKGANVVPGYWQRPDETQAAFTQGWLHSGDIGRLDDEGFLCRRSRKTS